MTSLPEPNVTTGPATISVAAVVYDMIAINIPDSFVGVVAEIEARIEEQQTSDSAPIIFTARINSRGQQPTLMIPQRSVAAIDKSSAYFVKVSNHRNIA